MNSNSFLERIVAHKQRELAERRAITPEATLERLALDAPAPRLSAGPATRAVHASGTAAILPASICRQDAGGPRAELFSPDRLGVIAEVKRASPSKGAIALGLDAVDMARDYAAGDADAISVLTDEEFYKGSLDDLRAIRAAVPTPVMRKDFILDRYGLLEARAAGADLVLLIVAVLGRENLPRLMRDTAELGMTPLVEAYTRDEAELALEADAALIGVNNRDLHTFEVALETTERLAPLLAPHATVVSLSGIFNTDDAARVVAAGARAILVGEALVRAADPARLIRELRSVPVTSHPRTALTPQPMANWPLGRGRRSSAPLPDAGEGEPSPHPPTPAHPRGGGEG